MAINQEQLDGLATFVCVAELRGFSAAAVRLGMSPSAVSPTIQKLETRLGAALFARTTRSVVHSGTFEEAEIQIILLTNARTNRSAWPVAFHSALALRAGVTEATVQAVREQRLPDDPKLAALSALARSLIEQRGHLSEEQLRGFREAGYAPAQVLEVIAVVAASTMTNYAANMAKPELESAFQEFAFAG